jgi:predicted outer membrane protein
MTAAGAAFDRDYVEEPVECQEGNATLFKYEIQNRADPDIKEFARQTCRSWQKAVAPRWSGEINQSLRT